MANEGTAPAGKGGPTPEQHKWTVQVLGADFEAAPGRASARPAAAHHAASPAGGAKPHHHQTVQEQLDEQKQKGLETTRTVVILVGADALHETYNELGVAIEGWAAQKKKEIGALKPHQTPTGGGVLLEFVKTINTMAKVAFPELEALEAVAAGLEVAGAVTKGVDDHGKEGDADSAQEVKEAQSRAQGGLDDLVTDTHRKILGAHKALMGVLEKAMANASADMIDQLNAVGKSEYQAIRTLLSDNFGIKRGVDADPGVTRKMLNSLDIKFRHWLKTDFQERHMGKLLDKAANAGSHEAEVLQQIYVMYISDDPQRYEKVKKDIADAKRHFDWPYEEEMMKMVHKLNEQYDDMFNSD